MGNHFVYGPTFAEMRDPSLIRYEVRKQALALKHKDPLHPLNLFNITWKLDDLKIPHVVLPRELTGLDANIVVMIARHFPTGAHKVGPAYSCLIEKQLAGELQPGRDRLVFPSTGNYGIGGAWVGPRMNYESLVVLPAEMSAERFEKIESYGARVIKTPGSESNVKEIYDKVHELKRDAKNKILNQFAEFGNYRFHFDVTGHAAQEVVNGIGNGKVAAFVSAMGSAGTIAAGDFLKQQFPDCRIVGLEPVQCPTLYDAGFGAHAIEGIGDKHVTWIHNVLNMDWLICIDDQQCLKGLQLLQEGTDVLMAEGVKADVAKAFVDNFGISSVCNIIGAIKTAKVIKAGKGQNVVTIATDGFDRYPSVMQRLNKTAGKMTHEEGRRRLDIFRKADVKEWVQEGTAFHRTRWHNQKYYTWVEQQGKGINELRALADPEFWVKEQAKTPEMDKQIAKARGF
ncbi:MAG: pyridoxal-phosphate dependent enzyme [Verrucomicrobiia bacterium]|jgi:cysteine synthase